MIWCRQLQLREDQLACLRNPNNDSIAEFNACLRVPNYPEWPARGMNLRVTNPHVQTPFNAFAGDISAATECEDLTLAALSQHTNVDVQSHVANVSRFMRGFAPWASENNFPSTAITPQQLAAYRRILSRSFDREIRDLAQIPNAEVLQYISLIQFLTGGTGGFYEARGATPGIIYTAVHTRPSIQVQPVQLVCPPAPAPIPPSNASYTWQQGALGATGLIALGASLRWAFTEIRARNFTPANERAFFDHLRREYRGNSHVEGILAGWEAQMDHFRENLAIGRAVSEMPSWVGDGAATATQVDSNPELRAQLLHTDSVFQTGFEAGVRKAADFQVELLRQAQERVSQLEASNELVSSQLSAAEAQIESLTRELPERIEQLSRALGDQHQGDLDNVRRQLIDVIVSADQQIKAHAAQLHGHFKHSMMDRFNGIHESLDALIARAEEAHKPSGPAYRASRAVPAPFIEGLRVLRGTVSEVLVDLRSQNYADLVRQYEILEREQQTAGLSDALARSHEVTRRYATDPTTLISRAEVIYSEPARAPASFASDLHGPQAGSAIESQGPTLADAVLREVTSDFQGDGFEEMSFGDVGDAVRAELTAREAAGNTGRGSGGGETTIRNFLEEVAREGAEPFSPERAGPEGLEGSFMRRMRVRLGR